MTHFSSVISSIEYRPPSRPTPPFLMLPNGTWHDFLTLLPRELVYWEERAGLLAPLNIAAPSWRRLVGVTLRARTGTNPAAQALINALQAVGGEFS